MEKEKNKDTEDFLKEFSLKPAPPALRDKILQNAYGKRGSNHVMAVLWKGIAVCLFLSILVTAVDAALSRAQHKRLWSFRDEHQEISGRQEEEWSILKDIIGEQPDSPNLVLKIALSEREETNQRQERRMEWREIFKEELE